MMSILQASESRLFLLKTTPRKINLFNFFSKWKNVYRSLVKMPKETFCVKGIKSNCFSNGCNARRVTVHNNVGSETAQGSSQHPKTDLATYKASSWRNKETDLNAACCMYQNSEEWKCLCSLWHCPFCFSVLFLVWFSTHDPQGFSAFIK